MIADFAIFGVMSPLLAKFTTQLMEAVMPNLAEAFENPTALDSWTQFYKNVSSLGFSLTLILFSSLLSNEYARGTLVILGCGPVVLGNSHAGMCAVPTGIYEYHIFAHHDHCHGAGVPERRSNSFMHFSLPRSAPK